MVCKKKTLARLFFLKKKKTGVILSKTNLNFNGIFKNNI